MSKWWLPLMLLSIAGCSTTRNQLDADVRDTPERYLVVAVHNDDVTTSIQVGSTGRGYDQGSGYAQSARARKTLNEIARDYQLLPVDSWPIQTLHMQCAVFRLASDNSTLAVDNVITRLQQDKRVELAQTLNTFVTDTTPNPSVANYQSMQLGMQRMDIDDAHQWSRGQGIRIAIIDTGMDTTHQELKNRISSKQNFVDDNQIQFNHDRHGTAVAGVIAASLNDGTGIVGVAPEAQILALKACWQLQADRDEARCNSFTLAQALSSAIDSRAHVINLSIVGPADPLLLALIKQAQQRGTVVVGAADTTRRTAFPASIDGVIAVSAMEQSSDASSTVTAPGRDVLTLIPGDRYDFRSGNSIATAAVSGTVALLLASQPYKSLDEKKIRELLVSSSETSDKDNYSSINACRALSQLLNRPGCGTVRATGTAAR